jgi:hypothetical protein
MQPWAEGGAEREAHSESARSRCIGGRRQARGRGMTEPTSDKIVIGAIGSLVTTVIGAAIGWFGWSGSIGAPLTTLLAAVGGISGLIFSLMYKRYIGVLAAGGGRKGYPARDAYERLRASLSGGNLASRLYADWLTKFLDAVDRFFGDAGMADRTLFPRAFGLKTPAPLCTAPAFDRCLLLALITRLSPLSSSGLCLVTLDRPRPR